MVRALQKMNGLVFGIDKRSGFTLIELMIVILIIAIMASVVGPRLFPQTARMERDQFMSGLNALMRVAATQAVATQALHQIYWRMADRIIELRKHTGAYDRAGDPICKSVTQLAGQEQLKIPERFIIKKFIIEGVNELAGDRSLKEVWFYVVPDGTAQQVSITLVDTHEEVNEAARTISLTLNPFTVQFTYET
jgi:type II secretion system protein H